MELKRLGDYVDIKTGKLDANASNINGKYPFFTCSINNLWIDTYAYDCECVLIAGNGDLNVKYYIGKFNAYQRTYIVESKDNNKLYTRYLFYFMSKYVDILRNNSIGGVIKYIKLADLTEVFIPLPSLETQKKIVAVLDKAQALIDARKEQIRLMDELIQAQFIEMFGDPVTNPKGWKKETIGNVVKSITAGWSANGEARFRNDDEKAVLKVSAVTQGYFKEDEYKVINKNDEIKKHIFPQKGDLLFSRANTREMVGATCVIDKDYPNLLLPDKLWKVLFTDQVDVHFMKYTMTQKSIRAQFSAQSTGTSGSMYNVSMDKFKKIKIPIPPIQNQNQFTKFIEIVNRNKNNMNASLEQEIIIYKALIQKYFS